MYKTPHKNHNGKCKGIIISFYLAFVNVELEGPILIPNDGQLFSFLPNNGNPCKAYHHDCKLSGYILWNAFKICMCGRMDTDLIKKFGMHT